MPADKVPGHLQAQWWRINEGLTCPNFPAHHLASHLPSQGQLWCMVLTSPLCGDAQWRPISTHYYYCPVSFHKDPLHVSQLPWMMSTVPALISQFMASYGQLELEWCFLIDKNKYELLNNQKIFSKKLYFLFNQPCACWWPNTVRF